MVLPLLFGLVVIVPNNPEIRHASNTCTQHSFMEPFNIYLKAWKHETIQHDNKQRTQSINN